MSATAPSNTPEPNRRSKRRRGGCNVVNIVGALRIIDRTCAVGLAKGLSPLRSAVDREAGVQSIMKRTLREFRREGLRAAELEGAMIVAEALLRKEMNRRARQWSNPL